MKNIFALLLVAVMLLAFLPTANADTYGQASILAVHLDGYPTASDTTDYISGATDSVSAVLQIGDLYDIADSIAVTAYQVSDTGNVKIDVGWATKNSSFGQWSTWTIAINDWTTESTDSTFYLTGATMGPATKILGLIVRGVTGNDSYNKVTLIVSGMLKSPDPSYGVFTYRGSTLIDWRVYP